MRKSLALVLCFLLVCSMIIPVSLGYNIKNTIEQQPSTYGNGNTLYVGGTGPDNYTRIQDAIDDAVDGDTVFVYDDSSPYNENIVIEKSINLIGEDKNTTIIKSDSDWTIDIQTDRVCIKNFNIQNIGSLGNAGLRINTKYCNITKNIFDKSSCGIYLTGINNNIFENYFSETWYSIYISKHWGYEGISYSPKRENKIYTNIFTKNAEGIVFENENDAIANNYIFQNDFFYNSNGIHIYQHYYSGGSGVMNNYFYSNNFIGNTYSNVCETNYGTGWNNMYDYKGQGNFWDDYMGVDNNNDGIGDTPYRLYIGIYDNYPLIEPNHEFDPNAPDKPDIYGPTNPKIDVEYDYTIVTTDPNNDDVYYFISWDDGTYEEWIGPNKSEESVTIAHRWSDERYYTITVQAMDENGLMSPWGVLHVSTPRNRDVCYSFFMRLLDGFPILGEVFLRFVR